jgi:imidazoleglycerol-phosphate dehydratase/histidinol-phosphatase
MDCKILFIDRDGTLVEEPKDKQVDAVEKVRLVPGVIPALLLLKNAGYRFVMVSNQDGLGTESFPQTDFDVTQAHILQLFTSQGIIFDEIFICPHFDSDNCDCRKPKTGLLTRYLARTVIDIDASAVIGDRSTDIELASRLGLRGLLVNPEGDYEQTWEGICDALQSNSRTAEIERVTRETAIRARVALDQDQPVDIRTGIGFFDHMLEQIAKHGGFSLQLDCKGDLDVDEHHTVEDVAICLGSALKKALGDKRGIGRYGFLLPMDESEARITLDLSGRGSFAFKGTFPREAIGGLPAELVPHFFRSLSESLGAALHIEVSGENAHHMVEACFKSAGRCLRQAIRIEGGDTPSTKGTLS